MFKNNLIKKIANFLNLKELGKRAITVIILTLTAIITVWVYAAFTEPLAGPTASDQDFSQNILGANNADNDFSSSNVASNADGSIIERQEYLQTQINTNLDATVSSRLAAASYVTERGTDNAALASNYTSARATKIDNLDATISSRAKGFHECSDNDAVGTICGGVMKFGTGLVVTPSNCTDSTTPVCNGATDALTKTWSATTGSDEPADSTTDGWSNTGNLVYNTLKTNDAAQYCFDMVYGGYSDWYLPAKDQLNTLYGQKATVGGFIAGAYWSSTEYSTLNGWAQNFDGGGQGGDGKTNAHYVRCVRSY